MICKTCGRVILNEDANFCEYCGTSFRDKMQPVKNAVDESGQQSMSSDNDEKSISFLNWMGTMFLPFVPLIGPFIYIIMLFVWSFGSEVPKSKKNWARATLLIIAIAIIIMVLFISSFMTEYINSGLSLEGYMNQYMNDYMNQYY